MVFIKLRMTCSHKAEQMIFELFTGLVNHALTEFRIDAFNVSLLSPDRNFIPSPVMQFSIVAASTCFVRFLAKRDLTLSDHCLQSEEHCVDVFHSSEPSSELPFAIPAVASNRTRPAVASIHT